MEGGATRGVFTAGALDYLMEKEYYFPYVVGVSAGACNAVDYVSKQIGRTKECMIVSDKAYQYISMKNIVIHRSLFDMDMIFDKFPNNLIPFDYETYFSSPIRCEIVATNCFSGQAEYLTEKKEKKRLMQICRASSSLPVASPITWIDGVPYLDGGIGDSIPIVHALRKGYKKNVVILTRKKGYRKPLKSKSRIVYLSHYRKYPELVKAILLRPYMYNKTMDFIDEMEEQGRIFVLRPDKIMSRTERRREKLEEFYESGYLTMEAQYEKMMEFLGH